MDLPTDRAELRRALDERVAQRERLATEIVALKVLLSEEPSSSSRASPTYSNRIVEVLTASGRAMGRSEILAAVNEAEPTVPKASLGGLLSKLRKDGRVANPKRGLWCAL